MTNLLSPCPLRRETACLKGLFGHKIVGTDLSSKVKVGVCKESSFPLWSQNCGDGHEQKSKGVCKESSFAVWTSVNEEVLQMKQSEVEIGEYIVK